MNVLTVDQIARLRAALVGGAVAGESLSASIGGSVVGDGVWRFFSSNHPGGGVARWNADWCAAWALPKEQVFAFGEDVFGNQLVLVANEPTVYVCDHENALSQNLELGVVDLLDAVVEHGLAWIDFYANGSLEVAAKFLAQVSWEQHLHWTQPLILGGAVSVENVCIVDRFAHLAGHATLWAQVSGVPPGTEIRVQ